MNDFNVRILGSSSAIPTSTRMPSAQLVSHQYKLFLVDCGEGTQIQLRKNKIRFIQINHIFISHLHGDHFFGLIGLLSSFNLYGRKTDLHIYAPEQLEEVINLQLKVSDSHLNFKIHFHALQFQSKTLLFENKGIEIFSFPLNHSIPTCGFLFKEKPNPRKIRKEILKNYKIADNAFEAIKQGEDFITEEGEIVPNDLLTKDGLKARSYAYCSDTAYSAKTVAYIDGVDTLYHESSFMEDMRAIAESKMHSTTLDAARTAIEAGAKQLIVGHFSARYKELGDLLAEVKGEFRNTILAEEHLKIEI
jgi:ribonuclease Z